MSITHTFFSCWRWDVNRRQLERKLGIVTLDKAVSKVLKDQKSCDKMATFTEIILCHKKADLHKTDIDQVIKKIV